MLNSPALISRLDHFATALPTIIACVTETDARWKPPSGNWSILEIVCHLGDEEVDDFRTRVRSTLENPSAQWPPIDPEGWARTRNYNAKNLTESIDRFVRERKASTAWLRSLQSPDWTRAHHHPKFGPISAADLLASWAAHDALHLRQLAKRLHELAQRDGAAGEASITYAGEWRA